MARRSSSPSALASHSPDGLTENVIDAVIGAVYAEIAREGAPAPTSWLSMSDDERAAIRARRRHLRMAPVQAIGQASGLLVASGNEAA